MPNPSLTNVVSLFTQAELSSISNLMTQTATLTQWSHPSMYPPPDFNFPPIIPPDIPVTPNFDVYDTDTEGDAISTSDHLLSTEVEIGIVIFMIVVYFLCCCNACIKPCNFSSTSNTASASQSARSADHADQPNSPGDPHISMIPFVEAAEARTAADVWQEDGSRHHQVPHGYTLAPPPSFSALYESKQTSADAIWNSEPFQVCEQRTSEGMDSQIVQYWRIVIETSSPEELDEDLPVFKSPMVTPVRPKRVVDKKSSSSSVSPLHYDCSMSQSSTPSTVPSVILDDCTGTRVSLNAYESLASFSEAISSDSNSQTSSPVETAVCSDRGRSAVNPKITSEAGIENGGVNCTHESGYSSSNTPYERFENLGLTEVKDPDKFESFISIGSFQRCERNDTGDAEFSSRGSISRPYRPSDTRLTVTPCDLNIPKNQSTRGGQEIVSDFHNRSRNFAISTGSYIDTIQDKNDKEKKMVQKYSRDLDKSIASNKSNEENFNQTFNISQTFGLDEDLPTSYSYGTPSSASYKRQKLSPPLAISNRRPVVGPIRVRIQIPSGNTSSYVVATKSSDDLQKYVAHIKPHPVYPIKACSVQVLSGHLIVDTITIDCLSATQDILDSFGYGLV